jgi:hypothetical protein
MSDFFQMMFQGAAGAGGGAVNVSDVFSTHLHTGNGSSQTITNGIDLSGEGGAVIFKSRTTLEDWHTYDTERGTSKRIALNQTTAQYSGASTYGLTAFNSDGFSVGTTGAVNGSGINLASWTFRKAPKFFDCVQYTGNGSAINVNHSLGCTPGFVVIKRLDSSSDWTTGHRSNWASVQQKLNSTEGGTTNASFNQWTDTHIRVVYSGDIYTDVNRSGGSYVMYLFAHNDGDGEFGPNADQDIIKCGIYSNPTNGLEVNLGFEPQFLMLKRTNGTGNWIIVDKMRGLRFVNNAGDNSNQLRPNLNAAENTEYNPHFTARGFQTMGQAGGGGGGSQTYIYVAIRNQPTSEPESVDDFFDIATKDGTGFFDANWPADFVLQKNNVDDIGTTSNWIASMREMDNFYVSTNNKSNESANNMQWYVNKGIGISGTDASDYCWMWRSMKGVCDFQMYKGNGTSLDVYHNLGVNPEMIWVKRTGPDADGIWVVYHKDLSNTQSYLELNDTSGQVTTNSNAWQLVQPTYFRVGSMLDLNRNTQRFMSCLFATKAGFTKVGSYTGNGSSQTIDCGFTNGAKLVMIKKYTAGGDGWLWFDSDRGIISGNSPYLYLDDTSYQFSSQNYLSPHSSGFTVPSGGSEVNASGVGYIFYAIAAP